MHTNLSLDAARAFESEVGRRLRQPGKFQALELERERRRRRGRRSL